MQLTRFPAGYTPVRAEVSDDYRRERRVQQLRLGPPGTVASAPPGGPSSLYFTVYPVRAEAMTPKATKGAPTGTVQGLPAWYVVDDDGQPSRWVRSPTCFFSVGAEDRAGLPAEPAVELLTTARLGTCDDQDTGGPMVP